MTITKTWNSIITLTIIWVFAIVIRYLGISNGNIYFVFDQARDAYISRQIIENHDFKIMGPSASGSQDKLYHGVLYYYIIGPLYTLFSGDPTKVALVLGIIGSAAIFPFYFLIKSFAKNKPLALMGAAMLAFSFETIQLNTWLSNPSLATLSTLCYYFFLWEMLDQKQTKLLPITLFFLGITNQFFLLSFYLWIPLVGGVAYLFTTTPKFTISNKIIVRGLLTYGLTIATMIATQIMQTARGVGSLAVNEIINKDSFSIDLFRSLSKIWTLYLKQFSTPIFPLLLPLSLLLAVISLVIVLRKIDQKRAFFLIICLIAPVIVLSIQPRDAYHTLIGFTPLVYLVVLESFNFLPHSKIKNITAIVFLLVFLITNLGALNLAKKDHYHLLSTQGGMLQESLAAIDYTYEQAGGEPFTISTLTNPYQYNTTWSYLYSWYGQNKYGYLPEFFGPSQDGIFAGERLARVEAAKPKHFSIIEKNIGLDQKFISMFPVDQNQSVGSPSATLEFSGIKVENRSSK